MQNRVTKEVPVDSLMDQTGICGISSSKVSCMTCFTGVGLMASWPLTADSTSVLPML